MLSRTHWALIGPPRTRIVPAVTGFCSFFYHHLLNDTLVWPCPAGAVQFVPFLSGPCLTEQAVRLPDCPTGGVPVVSPSRGGDVAVYVIGLNQPSMPAPFFKNYLFCSCIYFCLYDPFDCTHSINPPDNFLLSYSVLPLLFLPYWSFQ